MPRPAGISEAEWRADVQGREAVTTDRRRRLGVKKIRDAGGGRSGRGVPRGDDESARPQPLGRMEGSSGCCVAGQPLAVDAALGFNYVDADVDEIITSGSVAVASHPEFGVQDETMDTTDDIDDELDDAKEEAVEVEPEPVTKKKGSKRKRAVHAKPAEPHVKWMSKEGECLAEAWKTVSIDPITDANQNTDTYSRRIKTAFDERKLVDPDFANIHMDRGEKAMSNRWLMIQTACNK
ncbi:putative methionyl-tRNA synthetase [Hordeum vulgare]|nr:putative methionyl-tRNA synthetase [Hordeum vulgare]